MIIFGRSRKWREWRQHIADRCDAFTRDMNPPIALRDIFAQCHVKKVVFQPLLVEAALALDEDGFVVFVNSDESSKDAYQSAFDAADQKGRYLPSRVRFSLAHELIHTFFYDTKQHPYVNRLNGTHAKEIESLEGACNFGASHLLLPTRLLRIDARKRNVLTVAGIIDLAKRYQVSIECLVTRLERLEDWTSKRGLVAFVRQIGDEYRIKAVAKTVSIRELFKNVCVDAAFEAAFEQIPLEKIRQKSSGITSFDLTYQRGGGFDIAKCQMEYRRLKNANAFVLALTVDDRTESTINKHKSSSVAGQQIAKLREAITHQKATGSDSTAL